MNPNLLCFQCMRTLDTQDSRCQKCGYDNHIRINGNGYLPFSTVKNRYLIGKALGRGGFGVTYIGLDLSLERRVAIKEYLPGELVSRANDQSLLTPHDEECRTTFERGRERSMQEARTIARINDVPDIVNVHDVFLANNTLYIVMEFIEGETLRARIKREGGKTEPEVVLNLLRPVFGALSLIHEQGIIHRDVSPDNIMFRKSNGRAVLLDFGAAHDYSATEESEHSTSLRPGYAPIEQYSRHGKQDARTDEYALCATMYYAITGQKPPAAMERHFADIELTPPSVLGAAMPPAFEAALLKGLSIKADDRFKDIPELQAALDKALQDPQPQKPIQTPELSPDQKQELEPSPLPEQENIHDGRNFEPKDTVPVKHDVTDDEKKDKGNTAPHEKKAPDNSTIVVDGEKNGKGDGKSGRIKNKRGKTAIILTAACLLLFVTALGLWKTGVFDFSKKKIIVPSQNEIKASGSQKNAVNNYGIRSALNREICVTKDDWMYVYRILFDYYHLKGYLGEPDSSGLLEMPKIIDEKKITGIAKDFSERVSCARNIKTIILSDTIETINEHAFTEMTGLENIEGGKNLAFMEYERGVAYTSPYYKNNRDKTLILGSVLLHIPLTIDSNFTMPEGIQYIAPYAFATTNDEGYKNVPSIRSLTLPASIKKVYEGSLEGFNGETLTIPDGIIVDNNILGFWKPCTNLKTIRVGKDVSFSYSDIFAPFGSDDLISSFGKVNFSGTLYLEDGATLDQIQGLFGSDCSFTLSCENRDALTMPAEEIPSNITIVYRNEQPSSSQSEYPDAFAGLTWKGRSLKLTSAFKVEGDKLAELRKDFDNTQAQFLTLEFSSPDGDIPLPDFDNYAELIRLCDNTGNLYGLCVRGANFTGLDPSHSTDDYCHTMTLTYELAPDAELMNYILFVPGDGDAKLYTYGAKFTVPDRRVRWDERTFWLGGYSDGSSFSDDFKLSLTDNEQIMELIMYCCDEAMYKTDQYPDQGKIISTDGTMYDVRGALNFKRDMVEIDGVKMMMATHIGYVIPKDTSFNDYRIQAADNGQGETIPVIP